MTASIVDRAARAVLRGEIVGVPTDTVYGLAVDPWDESAVASLYEAKGRPERKPIGILAASMDQIEAVAELGGAIAVARAHWPGALTLVVRPKVVVPDWVGDRARGTIGVRIPDHDLLSELLVVTGPLAVTSANRSGGPETRDDGAARRIFGSAVAVYLPGTCPGGVASTVVDATGSPLRVLRQGPVFIDGAG